MTKALEQFIDAANESLAVHKRKQDVINQITSLEVDRDSLAGMIIALENQMSNSIYWRRCARYIFATMHDFTLNWCDEPGEVINYIQADMLFKSLDEKQFEFTCYTSYLRDADVSVPISVLNMPEDKFVILLEKLTQENKYKDEVAIQSEKCSKLLKRKYEEAIEALNDARFKVETIRKEVDAAILS
jgi:hypothetical protein